MKTPTVPTYRLLIVDDNEAIHDDLRKILSPSLSDDELLEDEALLFGKSCESLVNFEIDSAFQGGQGLEMVVKAVSIGRPYALAFVDVRMPPGWDGIETIFQVWKRDPELQIVICTAHSDYSWNDIERRLGLSHNLVILKKPFDPIEVIQLAHALTAKWEAARAAKLQMKELDRLVDSRTRELHDAMRELEQSKQAAEVMALEDPLTRLPNRRHFLRRLTLALDKSGRRAKPLCAVLYLDLDRFKVINDSLGHLAGDELLVEIADRLRSCVREGGHGLGNEDLIARIGGDEFAILLEGVRGTQEAVRAAERICSSLSAPFSLRGKDTSTTASIGIVTSENNYSDSEAMMRDADSAMYRAKAAGGGIHAIFDESMHRQNLDQLQKESEMRGAIDRREFLLYYQPIVSLKTGKIEAFEALLRWRSPHRGIVGPDDFIELCEETGFIVPIGTWALREACRQAGRWRNCFGESFTQTISVNISARQFLQSDLISTVTSSLRESGIERPNVRLELTETATFQDPKRAAFLINQLHGLGVRLTIDDFGTGYSSLSYLHRFNLDTLKIDRAFIANMESDERSLNIVRTIISLARNLHMDVVAEGVETAEQARLLTGMGCDFAQGFYFYAPAPEAEIQSLLTRLFEQPVAQMVE